MNVVRTSEHQKQRVCRAAKAGMGVLHTVLSLMRTRNTTEARKIHMKIKAHF